MTESGVWLVLLFGVLTAEDGEEQTPIPVTAGGTCGTRKGLHSLRCPRVKESLVNDCEKEADAIEKDKEGRQRNKMSQGLSLMNRLVAWSSREICCSGPFVKRIV